MHNACVFAITLSHHPRPAAAESCDAGYADRNLW